jgi:hypothetical protein
MRELGEYFKALLFNCPEVLGMAPVDLFFSLTGRMQSGTIVAIIIGV